MRTPGFTMANKPQNVKNTVDSMPLAAAVVARMVVGQIRVEMAAPRDDRELVLLLDLALLRGFERLDAREQVRERGSVVSFLGGGHAQAFLTR